ncbi:polynucleotide 5'-hydroxyl-kinase NOL9 [Drosophila innubila]|uniref:polynucleotide 5'-hydroxyl-kinase NOL9 n=1 Tax=Drosophila innubila TaxID=198719 RepID=UPI00148CF597|nr:polynucleotide 5'-hydroxyl-kinase NOL9 [Drosophila innubila]
MKMTKTGKHNQMKHKNNKTKPKKELTVPMKNNKESSEGSSCVLQKGSKRKVEPVNATRSDKRVKLNPKQVANGSDKRSKKPNRVELEVQDEDRNLFEDFDELSNDSDSESDWVSDDSVSQLSLDSDEEFFRKPQAIECEASENIPLQSDLDTGSETENEELPWLMGMDAIEAAVTKVKVFEGMFPEMEPKRIDERKKEVVEFQEGQGAAPIIEEPLPESEDAHSSFEEILPELSIFENSLKSNTVLAVLKQDMELYGTVVVTVLCGRITINGYKARKLEPLTIYSPKGFNWVVISPKANKKPPKVDFVWEHLDQIFSRAQVENILSNYDKQRDAIILLKRNSRAQNVLSTFSKHMSENVFPLVNATNRPNYSSEYLLNCLIQSADKSNGLQVPTVWTKLPLKQDSRLMVTGGKGVGKSTLLRYMLNRHLEQFPRVLLIDLDIGQPELFVPQTVSCTVVDAPLLGPGLFLNKQPDIAFVVGHVNVVMCAEQYVRAVKKLLAYCWESPSLKGIPWLINTMGYNKGFGTELMALIVDCVEPTDLVQIYSTKAINNFDEPLDRQSLSKVVPVIYVADEFKLRGTLPKYTLHHLMCAVPPQSDRNFKPWTMSAKDSRYSNLLARLSATLHGNARNLTDCRPVQVDLDALQVLHLTSNEYSREELIAGMEANMVYLCKRSSADQPVECVGIGVVRAVDHKTDKVYLVPAMPFDRLTKVNCLVIGGGMCLPQGFFKDQGACVANKVPFVFVIDDSKSSKSVQQIYHRAPGFLGSPANKNV